MSPDSLLMAARCYEAKRTPQYACNGALRNDGGALQQNPEEGFFQDSTATFGAEDLHLLRPGLARQAVTLPLY